MSMRSITLLLICGTMFAANATRAGDTGPGAVSWLPALNVYGNVRYRTEVVDEDGIARRAVAHSVRFRTGLATSPLAGASALVEVTGVGHLGRYRASNSAAMDARYPVIDDPENLDVSQAIMRYRPNRAVSFRLGRQRLSHGDERFIGASDFRQTQQTFDAASVSLTAHRDWILDYDYAWQVRRASGRRARGGALDSDNHFMLVGYRGFKDWRLDAYAYVLDTETDAFDSETFGASVAYGWRRGPIRFEVTAAAASQKPQGRSPRGADQHYALFKTTARKSPWRLELGVEQLGGDASGAFQTPLGTLHKFQGATDQFLMTPTGGVSDLYARFEYRFRRADLRRFLGGMLDFPAAAHLRVWTAANEFRRENLNRRLGREWTVGVALRLLNATQISLQTAHYHAGGFARDTSKFWLSLEAEF